MTFGDVAGFEQPSLEVFQRTMEVVFDQDDGNTEHLERLTPEARLVYLLWCFDGEIQNGGFDQLFVNSLGDHSLEIQAGLKLLGAHEAHRLLTEAMSCFPDAHPAEDREQRWEQQEAFADDPAYAQRVDALSSAYYEGADNLPQLLDDYVRAHPDARITA
jgi:hypothetical protein